MTIKHNNRMINVGERERFKKRKSKKYKNLCSVAVTTLAVAGIATATTVKADEVISPEVTATEIVTTVTDIETTTSVVESPVPSTNLTETQPEPTQEATAIQEASDTQSGDIVVTNISEHLNTVISQAEQAGVQVKEEVVKDYGVTTSTVETAVKQAEIQANYAKQAEEITKVTEDYVAKKEVHAAVLEKIIIENNQLKEKYDVKIAAYNTEVKNVNAENTAIDAAYDKARQTYEVEVAKIEASNKQAKEQYETALKNYKAEVDRITQENNQKKTNYEQKLSDYNNRVQQVNLENQQLEAEYQVAYKTFQESVAQIKATNAERETAYNQSLVAYRAEVERINRENEEKRKQYEQTKASRVSNLSEIEAENNLIKQRNKAATDTYNKAKAIYDAGKAKYDREIAESQRALDLGKNNPSTVDNTYQSDVWINLKTQTLSNGIKIVANGNVTQLSDTQGENAPYKIYILDANGTVDDAHIIRSVNIVAAPTGDAVTKTGENTWELLVDRWVTLPNAVTLADGSKRDLEVKVTLKDAQYLYRQDIVTLSSRNGIIQISNSAGASLETAESIVRSYRIKNSNDNYLWADISLDLDGGQQHYLLSPESVVASVGGGVKYDGKNITTDPYLGFKFGKNPLPKPAGWGNDVVAGGLDNENSLPDGAVAVVSYGSNYTVETKNISGYLTTGMTVGDFGISADLTSHIIGQPPKEPLLKLEELKTPTSTVMVSEPNYEKLPEAPTVSYLTTPESPTKPTPKPLPNKPEIPTYEGLPEAPNVVYEAIPKAPEKDPSRPLPPKPEDPIYKQLPPAPAVPTVSYHLSLLGTQPYTAKTVATTEGVDVDRGLVAKGQTVFFELRTAPLAANRSLTTSGEISDYLPKGFEIDLEKTSNESRGYELVYDPSKHHLKGTFTKETLLSLNEDVTQPGMVPSIKVYGYASNDAATYKNAFTLLLNGGEGKVNGYTRTSNTVIIHTPGDPNDPDNPSNNTIQPIKANTNETGVKIDGKVVPIGGTNFYTITLDYDQYHDVTPDKLTIGKGFGAFDDYPEDVLIPDLSRATIVASDGTAVTGLVLADHPSVTSSDARVQESLNHSGIANHISGAFISILAEDPQVYYETVIKAKKAVTITIPMTVKDSQYNTGKDYANTAYQLDFGNGYKTNTVTNTTPVVKPNKVNTNANGAVINGKFVLANSVNYYKVSLDYSGYKGIEADAHLIQQGFFGVDDLPEEAVVVEHSGIQLVSDDNELVKGMTTTVYRSLSEAPEQVQRAMAKQGFVPKGVILVLSAEDPQAFYETYVKAGKKLTATLPMTVKSEMAQTGGQYANTAYQIDFGTAYITDTVVNNVPKLDPKKDVVIDLTNSSESLAGKDIEVGTVFNYKLSGAGLPENRGSGIFSYTWTEDYDETHDQYDGIFKIFAPVAFTTKDGVHYQAQAELTRYALQTVDTQNGIVHIKLDQDFLDTIDDQSAFKADLYLQMKRIAAGDVYNTYRHGVNNVEIDSNTIVTHTPVGNVLVNFLEEGTGRVLKSQVVDEKEAATGTAYDTSDRKVTEIITEDGKTYELVRHEGNETGKVVKGDTVVTYLYKEVLGSVTVTYKDKDGNEIKEPVVDTPEGSTGRDYDTRDNKPEEIVTKDGKTYKLIPNRTEGVEEGKVVKGSTVVTYFYEEIKADVVVHYIDEEGNVIKETVKDVEQGSTGMNYDTTDNKPEYITVNGVRYKLMPKKTIGVETGTLTKEGAEVTYVYHKIITNWIEEGTEKILKEKEDGEKERGSFDGYEFVETVVDKETGDITHIFKKIPAPVETPKPPKTPETPPTPKVPEAPVAAPPAPKAAILPHTGEASSSAAMMMGMAAMAVATGLMVSGRKEEN